MRFGKALTPFPMCFYYNWSKFDVRFETAPDSVSTQLIKLQLVTLHFATDAHMNTRTHASAHTFTCQQTPLSRASARAHTYTQIVLFEVFGVIWDRLQPPNN